MDALQKKLETININSSEHPHLWRSPWLYLSFAPQVMSGLERPCEEEDFKEFRLIVDTVLENTLNVHRIYFQNVMGTEPFLSVERKTIEMAKFGTRLVLVLGEQSEKNVWNTAQSVSRTNELNEQFCRLFGCQSISQYLSSHINLSNVLLKLGSKLSKNTWKTYPSAVASFKWILKVVERPKLFGHIKDVLPIALLILDDSFPDNVVIGLECMHEIIHHSYLYKEFVDNDFAKVYQALETLSHQKEVQYIIPLYACMNILLTGMEYWNHPSKHFQWTSRDHALSILINNMENEPNIELRHAYMSSLPQLISDIDCDKWCSTLVNIFVEYCEHHTDLRTLKATLQAANMYLLIFQMEIGIHCTHLHTTLLKLYTTLVKLQFDLTETPVLDPGIMQNLKDCISILRQLSPDVGSTVMNDDRVRSMFNSSLPVVCQSGDIKYFE